jgi:hypothetical protein
MYLAADRMTSARAQAPDADGKVRSQNRKEPAMSLRVPDRAFASARIEAQTPQPPDPPVTPPDQPPPPMPPDTNPDPTREPPEPPSQPIGDPPPGPGDMPHVH